MQALRLESVGNLFVREVDKPVPGPEDLLVRVEACGICGTDRHLFLGEFPSRPPVTIGHEFAGIIEAVGSGVTGGTVVILGVMPQGAKLEIEPFDILFRELRVLGSFLNPFTHRRAAELIASGAINVDKLISRTISLDEAPDVIGRAAAAGEIRVLIVP